MKYIKKYVRYIQIIVFILLLAAMSCCMTICPAYLILHVDYDKRIYDYCIFGNMWEMFTVVFHICIISCCARIFYLERLAHNIWHLKRLQTQYIDIKTK